MTEPHESSFLDEIHADPRGRVELALAHFSLRLEELFAAAVQARPEVDLDELAELMDVDRSRVDRLLEGEDAMPAEAFVRYMRALGYSPLVNAIPADDGVPGLPAELFEWDAEVVDTYSQAGADSDGVQTMRWTRSRTFTVGGLDALEDMRYIETIDTRDRRVYADESQRQPIVALTKESFAGEGESSITVFSRA